MARLRVPLASPDGQRVREVLAARHLHVGLVASVAVLAPAPAQDRPRPIVAGVRFLNSAEAEAKHEATRSPQAAMRRSGASAPAD